jgi:orotidine-5'-phosphate decarboxylase
VGDKLAALAEREQGACGYGLFGAVVGCTEREEAAEIRRRYPGLFFLIPGYGAQGGAAEDAVVLLQGSASGGVANGGVVNASRSLLQAWRAEQIDPEGCSLNDAALAARRAALKMRDEIRVLL